MGCFEVDEEKLAVRSTEMLDFMKSPEGKKAVAKIAESLPDVAKIDYISLMSNN